MKKALVLTRWTLHFHKLGKMLDRRAPANLQAVAVTIQETFPKHGLMPKGKAAKWNWILNVAKIEGVNLNPHASSWETGRSIKDKKDHNRLKWLEEYHKLFRAEDWKKANSDDFLASYEWRRVRMVALKKYGPRCQCCGATPADGVKMHVDHIKPRRIFPDLALDVSNLQILCEVCNHGKGNWDMTDWREPELDPEAKAHMASMK